VRAPIDQDIDELQPDEMADIEHVATALSAVMDDLERDHRFLTVGPVLTPTGSRPGWALTCEDVPGHSSSSRDVSGCHAAWMRAAGAPRQPPSSISKRA
jgi:hypothetical protein